MKYGNLQPILLPPVPYHTITMDFMMALPETDDSRNVTYSEEKDVSPPTLVVGCSSTLSYANYPDNFWQFLAMASNSF